MRLLATSEYWGELLYLQALERVREAKEHLLIHGAGRRPDLRSHPRPDLKDVGRKGFDWRFDRDGISRDLEAKNLPDECIHGEGDSISLRLVRYPIETSMPNVDGPRDEHG